MPGASWIDWFLYEALHGWGNEPWGQFGWGAGQATVSAPAAVVTLAALVPAVSGAASVTVPAAAITAAAAVPTVLGDGAVTAVTAAISVAAPVPSISAGVSLSPPAAVITVAAPVPIVSGGGPQAPAGGGTAGRRRVPRVIFQPRLVWETARTVVAVRISARGSVRKLKRSRRTTIHTSARGLAVKRTPAHTRLAVHTKALPALNIGVVARGVVSCNTEARGRRRVSEQEWREDLELLVKLVSEPVQPGGELTLRERAELLVLLD